MNRTRGGLIAAAGAVAVVALLALAAGRAVPQAGRTPPPEDPVRVEFARATAPGLADTTQARLAAFLRRYGRHPLARDAHRELGLLAYARGDYAAARDAFRRARSFGRDEESRYWEGLAGFALGRAREARTLVLPITQARKFTPRRWDAAYLVALTWAQEGRRSEALAAYRRLFDLEENSGEAAALYQAIRLARELGRYEDASLWRTRLLRGAPGSPEAASLLAEEKSAAADSAAARAARSKS